MEARIEQRVVIKFLVAEGEKASRVLERLQAIYGDCCLSKSQVYEWYQRFRDGRTSVSDDEHPGRPVSASDDESVAFVEQLVLEDRRVTIETLSSTTGISVGSVHAILHKKLKMRKVCAHWVPKHLQPDQKSRRIEVCKELLQLYEEQGDQFLDRIVTQDESWFHFHEPESKRSSMQWKHPDSPRPRKFRMKPSANKVLYSFFWDSKGVILQWPVEQRTTVTGSYHASLLRDHLHPALKRERRGRITAGVLLQQDNAPAHTSQVGMAAVAELGYTLVPHPPYSPDLAPSDFFLFGTLKEELRGRRFETRSALGSAIYQCLQRWPQQRFFHSIHSLPDRWRKCVEARGDYFECDV